MPSPIPTRDQIKRELLELSPYATYFDRVELYEPFKQRVLTAEILDPDLFNSNDEMRLLTGLNRNWSLEGTTAAFAGCVLQIAGGIIVTTSSTANDQAIVVPARPLGTVPQTLWREMNWAPEFAPRLETTVEFPGSGNVNFLFQIGFGLTSNLDGTTDMDKIVFQYNTASPVSGVNWTVVQSIAGVDTETDTGIPVVFGESIRVKVGMNSLSTPRFHVDGVLVFQAPAMRPTVQIKPMVGGQTLAAASKSFNVRYIRGCRRYESEIA